MFVGNWLSYVVSCLKTHTFIKRNFYHCTMHSAIHTIHSPTDALFINSLIKIYIKMR